MKHLTLFILMMTGIAFASNALAENGHAYNGSFCKSRWASQSSSINFHASGITNNSNGSRQITCPIIVDNIQNTQGTTQVWLHQTGSGRISCTLYSKNGNGTTREFRAGERNGTGWFLIPNITTDDYWGTYSMVCSIPKGSILNTIWVGEKG
ncbi:MAG: hypothetical protein K0U68_05630 [Gammaproteobacteria bacterium]|nr:hypothetical protein [Gammaproteobacteria bacterium]